MQNSIMSSKDLIGLRVVKGATGEKYLGRVRHLVFHPTQCKVVGVLVKRPDLVWMFHRSDLFVALDSFELEDDRMVISDSRDACDNAACRRLGLNWDACVLWSGMSIVTEGGQRLGTVGEVRFHLFTGKVFSILVEEGATAKMLLGRLEIPLEAIRGFRFGIGERISDFAERGQAVAEEDEQCGAILVSDEVIEMSNEGGLAELAGHVVGKAQPKAQELVSKASEAMEKGADALTKRVGETKNAFTGFKEAYRRELYDGLKDPEGINQQDMCEFSNASQTTDTKVVTKPAKASAEQDAGDTVVKVVGRQVQRSRGMFAAFKEEYNKARHE